MVSGRILLLVATLGVGCSSPPKGEEADAKAAEAAPADAVSVTEDPAPGDPKVGCDAVDLSLAASTVVGRVDGKDITAGDLGPDVKQAEDEARRTYCNDVDRVRAAGLQRAIDDRLVERAAASAKQADVDTFLRESVTARVQEPTDAEVAAYYEERKSEGVPPLAGIEEQVKASMLQERSRAAYEALLGELRATANIETRLPDVRPPAVDMTIPEHAPTYGNPQAAVRIVEFSDFECPYCARAAATVTELKAKYGDDVQLVFRHFPLSFHPNAKPAAELSQCANEQGKFWEVHDAIFANQEHLGAEALKAAAKKAGVDEKALEQCLASDQVRQQIETDLAEAQKLGVSGTPTFYVNGRLYNGAPTVEGFGQAIEAELARGRTKG
jgi:protein-disulfide isomerase